MLKHMVTANPLFARQLLFWLDNHAAETLKGGNDAVYREMRAIEQRLAKAVREVETIAESEYRRGHAAAGATLPGGNREGVLPWGGEGSNRVSEGARDGLKISDKQFGKKVGKHAEDFGLNPSSSENRDFVRNMANEIFRKPAEIREGVFRGQGVVLPNGANALGKVRFYIQGNDVVVTDMSNNFITIMKDGINNLYVKKSMRIWP